MKMRKSANGEWRIENQDSMIGRDGSEGKGENREELEKRTE